MTNLSELKNLFKNKNLLIQALTHKSWVNEHPGDRKSNERLEFLGDAVLEFVVSKDIYLKFPEQEEGYLTALRASLVNTKNLFSIAKKIEIGNEIFLSKGEEEGGGRENPSLLADTVEAIIGALYLDCGIETVGEFIHENLLEEVPEKIKGPLKDPKSILQEQIQAQGFTTPKYRVVQESGPDHDKKFVVEVLVNSVAKGMGEGKSKSQAEQEAAQNALEQIVVVEKTS
ncbi:ribonuclease III [Candidatus Woesebacteria bacterium]|nr:ribonuclease III [Candidatus Woesebacteria bacterium]